MADEGFIFSIIRPTKTLRGARYRVAVINSHPIQYFAPLYRRLACEPSIDLTVFYCSRRGIQPLIDSDFGVEVKWDIPLLKGYRSQFLSALCQDTYERGFLRPLNPTAFSAIREGSFDALWLPAHNFASYLLAMAGAKVSGTAVMMRCDSHIYQDRPPWKQIVRPIAMRAFYRFVDAFLTIGSLNAEYYRQHGVSEARMFFVPFTVDCQRFRRESSSHRRDPAPVRQKLGLPIDQPLVLFVGRLTAGKRPADLLKAFDLVTRNSTQAALAYVGSGEEEERLKQRAQKNKISNVHFLGFRNQTELPAIYGVADVLVLPSEHEAWGLVLNEAMAAGLPVVASNRVGAAPDLVDVGRNGYTYPVGNIKLLAERLSEILTDSSRRREMGRASQEIISNWDLDRCVEGVLDALAYVKSR